jgi:RHS repeat-associated protein
MALKHRLFYRKKREKFTGKELDAETGLYYYGARYLDPKTSRWLSGDPAMGEYFPVAPINDDAKKHNENLPGQGGVFNYVNLHAYHYAGNNPVKYTDPDGKWQAIKEQVKRFDHYLTFDIRSNTLGNSMVYIVPTKEDIRKKAEELDSDDLLQNGPFLREINTAISSLGLSGADAEKYKKEEIARYNAFKSLREKSVSLDEFTKIYREAEYAYKNALGSRPVPTVEDKRRAEAAANKVIDDFIQSKDSSYKPTVTTEDGK